MPNLAQHAALATDDGLRRRLHAALVLKATAALNAPQPPAEPELTQWRRRRGYAARALSSMFGVLSDAAWLVACDPNVTAALDDPDVAGNPALLDDPILETAVQDALVILVRMANVDDDSA
jgi:hypothetical protein